MVMGGAQSDELPLETTLNHSEELFDMSVDEALEGLKAIQHILQTVTANCLPSYLQSEQRTEVQNRAAQAVALCEQTIYTVEQHLTPVLREMHALLQQQPFS